MKQLKLLPSLLLDWYDGHRRDLPWRCKVSDYRTWVSEIMLQQTRVTAVLPYFYRFMETYPTIQDLAEANEEKLLRIWQGLGYYSRARNLQKAAKKVVDEYGGVLPADYKALAALPGIGDYTACAILSIAYGHRVPAVDGNVLRILSRLICYSGDIKDPANRRILKNYLEQIMPDRPGDFNQTLMDLGATVCLPNGAPLCDECPVRGICTAAAKHVQNQFPVRPMKKEKRLEEKTMFFLRQGGKIAICKRPDTGLLASLWEYPNTDGELDEETAAMWLERNNITPHKWDKKIHATHIFTHIKWKITGYVVDVVGSGPISWHWCGQEELTQRSIPSAFSCFEKEFN